MVIPWVGFSFSNFIKRCEPTSKAKFVEFYTLNDPSQMPGVRVPLLRWPYREGLRMDEAMHPLTILAVGLYGEVMPKQDGAPIRVIVPWKYGFKSGKSIVRIRFVEQEPLNTWKESASDRIWLLLERESDAGSPALEPGDRTPHRRVLHAQDRHVQRLWRSGRRPVRRDGSQEILLSDIRPSCPGRAEACRVRRGSWPCRVARVGDCDGQSEPESAQRPHERNRSLDAAVSLHHPGGDASPAPHRLERGNPVPPHVRVSLPSSTGRCTS